MKIKYQKQIVAVLPFLYIFMFYPLHVVVENISLYGDTVSKLYKIVINACFRFLLNQEVQFAKAFYLSSFEK